MADAETRIVAGTVSLDKFGERLFLVVQPGMRVGFGDRVITGGQVIRVLGGGTNLESEIFTNQSEEVSIAARLATPEELKGREPSQLTDPTLTAKKIVKFETVQKRAFEIFQSEGGAAQGNWVRSESELLAMPTVDLKPDHRLQSR